MFVYHKYRKIQYEKIWKPIERATLYNGDYSFRLGYATKRLIEILAVMDSKSDIKNLGYWKKRVEDRSGSFPNERSGFPGKSFLRSQN